MVLGKLKSALKQRTTDTRKRLVALDVGTEFIKALVGEIQGDSITVHGVGRRRQRLSDMHSGAISDIAGVVANCERALTEAEQQAGFSSRHAIIGIAGELVKGNTSTVRYKRARPDEPLSMEEMELIIQRVQEAVYKRARARLNWEMGSSDVEIKLVNSALVSIHIDGYKVTNPIGFQGRDVAIQLFTAFAPMIHIGALERVATELDLDLIAVAAEPFAVSRSVIGTDASSSLTSVLIDVGGGTTDIAVVNDGGVEGTKMFGIGGRSFTRTIASELGIEFDEAERMKLMLSSPQSRHQVPAAALDAIDKTLEVWLDGVELALSEFDTIDHLPNRIQLCGGGASLPQLVDVLKDRKWYVELPFTRQPAIQHIEPDQVVGIVDKSGKINDHTFITAMGLLRVGHDTMVGSSATEGSVRDKLNRILSI